jgi:hypothetical protein
MAKLTKLNSQDHDYDRSWIAHCARIVGGKYRIQHDDDEAPFVVRYFSKLAGSWTHLLVGSGRTFEEAVALAQADHDCRRAEREEARAGSTRRIKMPRESWR